MKDRRFTPSRTALLLLTLVATMIEGSGCRREPDYRELEYPELPGIVIPQVERIMLPNGMRLFLLEDHELPIVRVSALIRVGSIYEPAEKTGLAAITGTVMRTGGTVTRTCDELDAQLEDMGASMEIAIRLDVGEVSLSALKGDVDAALAILADVLRNPAFREDAIARAKQQLCSAIARRNDSSEPIALREFRKLVYGPHSPYARQVEYATLERITRGDVVAFHRQYFGPNALMVAVWGDFAAQEMAAKIERAFAGWPPIDSLPPEMPPVDYASAAAVHLVRKSNVNQSIIVAGHLGGLVQDPDYAALAVMYQVVCASYTGRLFKNIRARQGLAYTVGGVCGMEYSHPGVFAIGCATKSESAVQAARDLIHEIHRITEEEVADEELALAKEIYLNSFVFSFANKGEVITRLMRLEYYHYPPDFLSRTMEQVRHVAKADVLRATRRYLHPDRLQILVIGQPADFREPLSALGPVQEIDITIPPPRP
jgi:zinc protease